MKEQNDEENEILKSQKILSSHFAKRSLDLFDNKV